MKRANVLMGTLLAMTAAGMLWAANDDYYGVNGVPASTGIKHFISDCQAGALPGCVPGDDSNAGTSPDSPWQTIDRAQQAIEYNTPPGQQFLFARGGSFLKYTGGNGETRIADGSSSRNNPMLFDAYTPSWASDSSPLPILTPAVDNIAMFDFQNGGTAYYDEGYVVRNLDLRGGGHPSTGINLANEVSYVLMENLMISGFSVGLGVSNCNPLPGGRIPKNEYFTLRTSTITDNLDMGMIGGGNHFLIENNVFDNNGINDVNGHDHNIYVTCTDDGVQCSSDTFRHNILTRSAVVNGKCEGTSLVVHGFSKGLLIENNLIQEEIGAVAGGCWGIGVVPGHAGTSGTHEEFLGTIIRGNRIINVGNAGIVATSCPNCVIENNVIVQEQPMGFTAITIPDKNNSRGPTDAPEYNAIIRNNSIYLSAAVTDGVGIRMAFEGTNHSVVSNAIHYLGNGIADVFACFDTTGLSTSSFLAFDNNLCDFPNASAGNGRWELSAGSLANWQAKGMDTNSHQLDPQFISPGSPNYYLAVPAGSPAVNAGNLVNSSTMDITSQTRDALPDIGAYEYVIGGAVPPAAPTNLSATAVSSTSVKLTWTASPGSVSYRIYRGIVWVGSSATTSYPDTNLTPSTIYSYSVEAVGGNGLLSNQSVTASVTTQAGSVVPTGTTGTADPTPGLREAYAFPNPAKGVDPVIRAKLGLVDEVEITIFDAAGRAVHSATVDGGSATIVNGEYCYDYAWTGNKASGIYYAVINGKAGGKTFKARAAFAVVK